MVGISPKKKLKVFSFGIFRFDNIVSSTIWLLPTSSTRLGGAVGYKLNLFLQDYLGKLVLLILILDLLSLNFYKIKKISPENSTVFERS
jgi:S-DNA-T family DNA segregation ATPase FtsK/SpoIIIE